MRVPVLVCTALILLSPFGIGVYYIDKPGTFSRGMLYIIKPLTQYYCTIVQFIIIAIAAYKSSNLDLKKELTGPAVPCANPSNALALMYGYVLITSRKSSIDYLTGLNNRSVLEKTTEDLLTAALIYETEYGSRQMCRKIHEEIARTKDTKELAYDLSVSVGCVRVNALTEADLKQQYYAADSAMYREKEKQKFAGRGL